MHTTSTAWRMEPQCKTVEYCPLPGIRAWVSPQPAAHQHTNDVIAGDLGSECRGCSLSEWCLDVALSHHRFVKNACVQSCMARVGT